jgi:hypothetical protein
MSEAQAELVKVAEAIKEELNRRPFTLPFDAVRSYETDTELKDLGTLHVDVVAVNAPTSLDDRGSVGYACRVDIGVRKKLSQVDVDEVDRLMLLVQEIAESFIAIRLASYPGAAWQSTDIRVWYVPRHLRELLQFTGIVRVEFAVSKTLVTDEA